MPEWIPKLLAAVTNTKTALNLIFTVFIIVVGWDTATSFLEGTGIPSNIILSLITLTSFTVSVIVVDFIYLIFGALKKIGKHCVDFCIEKREKSQQQQKAKNKDYHEAKAFRNQLDLTFPHLDKASQDLLFRLFDRENDALIWKSKPTYELHKKGLITCIGHANGELKIYELNPIVRDYLSEYYLEKAAELSKDLDDNSRQFLRIFFDEVVPFGISEQEKWMDALVYKSHEKMVKIKAIKKINFTFILSYDFKGKLIRDGHFGTCYRTEVTLDNSLIHAYIPTTIGLKKYL